jgi:hypothetical protein
VHELITTNMLLGTAVRPRKSRKLSVGVSMSASTSKPIIPVKVATTAKMLNAAITTSAMRKGVFAGSEKNFANMTTVSQVYDGFAFRLQEQRGS